MQLIIKGLKVSTVHAHAYNLSNHEFHVACSGCFCSSCGELLTQISGWNNLLSKADTVVLKEDASQACSDDWVAVDHLSNAVEQPNDKLCSVVTRSSLQLVKMLCITTECCVYSKLCPIL